jgi:hypothetical protein
MNTDLTEKEKKEWTGLGKLEKKVGHLERLATMNPTREIEIVV